MASAYTDIWSLMAKYLLNEASPQECLLMEVLLRDNLELRTCYDQFTRYFGRDPGLEWSDSVNAFMKLNNRIPDEGNQ